METTSGELGASLSGDSENSNSLPGSSLVSEAEEALPPSVPLGFLVYLDFFFLSFFFFSFSFPSSSDDDPSS